MKKDETIVEKISHWIRNSITLKLVTIIILALLLLIPTSMIRSIIAERESLNEMTVREVSENWANQQLFTGPILTIPLIYYEKNEKETVEVMRYFHILPEELNIRAEVNPEILHRGIYEAVVYRSALTCQGIFTISEHYDPSNLKEVLWEKSFLTLGISDLRGIEDKLEFFWDRNVFEAEPGSLIPGLIEKGLTIYLPESTERNGKVIPFSFELKLQGSQNLSFVPTGSTTRVELQSPWPAPSFVGAFLPDQRKVNENGFVSDWKILELNRNFPQQWTGTDFSEDLYSSAFGVNLIQPLDDYRKSMRSAKYAIMTIALTFLIFFLVEILNKNRIHPFQYTLVGLALCLFFILLISISEHLDFNLAYLVSMITVILMIGLYSLSVFGSRKFSLLLSVSLAGIYGFLFVILQITDYALLVGSIGLTLILAATMYFTRNINWYSPKD